MKLIFFIIALLLLASSCVRRPMVYDEGYIESRLEKMRSPVIVVSKGGTTIMVKDARGEVFIFTVNSNSSLQPKDTIK